jgi:hypothetical protein
MAYRRYELTVRGQAASLVRAALPGFEIVERPPSTVIRGEVPDPATLEETIATVLRVGLHVYEVREIDEIGDPPGEADSA